MPKDPAFLFYYQDWLVGTYFLNRKQKGAYIDLLCYQADKGNLTMIIIKEILNSDFEDCWPKIKDKFLEENGTFYNKRLREEKEKRVKYSESRSINRKKICKTYDIHMENENEDINEIKNKEKEQKFKSKVYTFKNYPKDMLDEFILYWTEPNKSKTKLRYELQNTWDTGRRLATWSRNAFKTFNKKETKPVYNSEGLPKNQTDMIRELAERKTIKY